MKLQTYPLEEFNEGFTQIYRTTTVQISVDGAVATSKSKDYVVSAPISESPDYGELTAMAEKYIDDNYGDIFGGQVDGNRYTATTCVAEGKTHTMNQIPRKLGKKTAYT